MAKKKEKSEDLKKDQPANDLPEPEAEESNESPIEPEERVEWPEAQEPEAEDKPEVPRANNPHERMRRLIAKSAERRAAIEEEQRRQKASQKPISGKFVVLASSIDLDGRVYRRGDGMDHANGELLEIGAVRKA